MSAFAWLVSLAPLPVGSGQCLVFFPRLLFSACSFRCAWRFSRYSPQNGAEERFFDLLSRGQWGIKRSELLVRAHNWRLECGVESSRLWSTRDQGSNIACSEKKAKKPFPSVNNVFALRRPTGNKKLKLRFASISGVNLHNLSWTKSLWLSKIKTIF